jgi:hypothetical protein
MKKFALHLIAAIAPVTASFAKTTYEAPPTVRAADLVPEDMLSGPRYTIDPKVRTDGSMAIFRIHSDFGDFECMGHEMLYKRIDEIRALGEVDKVSRTKAVFDALGHAAMEPVKSAEKIVKHPVKSVVEVPIGAARFLWAILNAAGDAGKGLAHLVKHDNSKPGHPKPPPSREDPIGYNDARDVWARKLAVDPYTTNRKLALKLNHLAMITFGTDKVAGAGLGAAIGSFGAVGDWLSWLPDLDEHILTPPPPDQSVINARKLATLGVTKREAKRLLDNAWMTPPLQTRFVNGLMRLKGAKNPEAMIELAGAVDSEEQAHFLCRGVELLAHYHEKVAPLRVLHAYTGVPAGVTANGTLVAAESVDLLSWTRPTAELAHWREPGAGRLVLLTTGPLTKRAGQGFASRGWRVKETPPDMFSQPAHHPKWRIRLTTHGSGS